MLLMQRVDLRPDKAVQAVWQMVTRHSAKRVVIDSYFRAANGRKLTAGFGVGLYIVKAIVVQHRGRIEVDSTWGHGSILGVVLPLHAVAGA